MEKRVLWPVLKAYGFVTAAAVMIAVTCFSLVQGVLVHVSGNLVSAILLYILAWLCLGLGLLAFMKGRKLLQNLALSEDV